MRIIIIEHKIYINFFSINKNEILKSKKAYINNMFINNENIKIINIINIVYLRRNVKSKVIFDSYKYNIINNTKSENEIINKKINYEGKC